MSEARIRMVADIDGLIRGMNTLCDTMVTMPIPVVFSGVSCAYCGGNQGNGESCRGCGAPRSRKPVKAAPPPFSPIMQRPTGVTWQ